MSEINGQIEAHVIICHHSNNARILKCFKDSSDQYFCRPNETRKRVIVEKATIETLKEELLNLSIIIEDEKSIKIVANKFSDEMITRKNGKIAYSSEAYHQGLWKIVKYLK